MSVRIRLKRFGTKKKPFYRIVVTDSRTPRDGRVLEEIGLYHPIEKKEKQITVSADRVKDWLSRGATPSATVKRLLNLSARGRAVDGAKGSAVEGVTGTAVDGAKA